MLKIRCNTPTLQLRTPGAKASRCTMCNVITFVMDDRRSSSSPLRALPPP
ncbi:putative caspase [Corchorus olitorius]|uniref:Caspase n=1 Tax=Corchorus olitorius TaxID=93759 RepID=A0A1R3GNQ6_9ROSI|nr:putative caspase [Corchorus olitorius]